MADGPADMMEKILANLPQKTGRTADEWVAFIKAGGPSTRKERAAWLKSVHGLGGATAMILAEKSVLTGNETPATPEALIDAQYTGPKATLRPIYERVVQFVRGLGDDTVVDARQTYVSFTRRRQFGIIQASTKTRVDIGVRLDGVQPTERLQAAGTFGSGGTSHRIALTSPEEVDAEFMDWLAAAYAAAK